ncbi:VanZ family protein [Enterococcus sp. LJL90]
MNAYTMPILNAILWFPFIALLVSLPFFVIQYRRYGRFTISRGLILYAFVFYLLCAYFLVILPLPAREAVAEMTGPRYNLVFGKSLSDFLSQTVFRISEPSTYLPALRQEVFLEPMFNILLLFPFGIFLRYYFKFSLKKTILFSFCLSLFFELTQLSGLYFIYPRPYRLFDVNDLFHNTLGGTLGYLFTPLFTFMLPTRQQMDESAYAKGQQVTLIRRLVALVIDWLIISVVYFFAAMILLLINQDWSINDSTFIGYTVQILLYWVLLNYLLKGATPGKRLVKIQIVQEGRARVSLWALFVRYSLLYLVFNYLGRISGALVPYLNDSNHNVQVVALLVFIFTAILSLLYVVNILLAFILRKRVLFYEKASHTHVISRVYNRKLAEEVAEDHLEE